VNAVIYRLLSLFVVGILAFSPLATVFAASEEAEQKEFVPYDEEAVEPRNEQSDQKELLVEPGNPEVEEREPAETVEAPESGN
jgi:hypothetical protein